MIGDKTGYLNSSLNSVIGTLVGGFSPLYGTFIVLKRHSNGFSIHEFSKRILCTANKKKTIVITSVYCLLMLTVAILIGERTKFPWYIIIPAVPLMILGGGVEEVGWRGFLQPALEKKMPYILTVLIISFIWFMWHLPLWFISSSNQSSYDLIPYALQLLVNAFALATIYKVSKSTIACVLYHAWGNAIGALYEWNMFATYPISPILFIYDFVVILASIIIYKQQDHKDKTKHD